MAWFRYESNMETSIFAHKHPSGSHVGTVKNWGSAPHAAMYSSLRYLESVIEIFTARSRLDAGGGKVINIMIFMYA